VSASSDRAAAGAAAARPAGQAPLSEGDAREALIAALEPFAETEKGLSPELPDNQKPGIWALHPAGDFRRAAAALAAIAKPSEGADLRVDDPKTVADFVQAMAQAGVTLPLDLDPDDAGSIIDATGAEMLVADPNNELSDAQCRRRAMWIICAVNTCGGFIAERTS